MSQGNGVAPPQAGDASPVTARGVIRGEPAALAGVSSARGRAVLAYCEKVCGRGASLGAAVEAFARFRRTAFHADDPLALNPDELLLSSTRRAAATCVTVPERNRTAVCPDVPMLLAEQACGTLSARDRDRLRRHLGRCADCRDLQAAQQAGERAYRQPGERPLSEHEHAVIFASLATAVPSAALSAGNGSSAAHEPSALPVDAVTALAVPVEEPEPPTTTAEEIEPPAPEAEAAAPHAEQPPEAMEREPVVAPPRASPVRTTRVLRREPVVAPPRAAANSRRRDTKRLRDVAAHVLAPAAVVVIAVLGALALAGAFGSGGHGSGGSTVGSASRAVLRVEPATPPTPLPSARQT